MNVLLRLRFKSSIVFPNYLLQPVDLSTVLTTTSLVLSAAFRAGKGISCKDRPEDSVYLWVDLLVYGQEILLLVKL